MGIQSRQVGEIPAVGDHTVSHGSASENEAPQLSLRDEELDRVAATMGGDYVWVKRRLLDLPRENSEQTRRQLLALVRGLSLPDNVTRLIGYVRADAELLAEIAQRSYRHTNHFDKIVLVDSGSQLGYRLTLHLWQPPYTEAEAADEQIHDHRFSFWSGVLVGKVVFQNFVRDASGVMFNEYQYIPEKLNVSTVGNYYLDVGKSPLLETPRSGGEAGTCYYLPYSQIHRVVLPETDMTCTMVLRGPRQKNYASVFSSSRKYDPSGNVMFAPTSLSSRLSTVIREIEVKRC